MSGFLTCSHVKKWQHVPTKYPALLKNNLLGVRALNLGGGKEKEK